MAFSVENRQFFLPREFNAPAEGFPWNWVSAPAASGQKTRMMWLSGGRKSFKIGLAVLIQYRRVSDTEPTSHQATLPWQRSRLRIRRARKKKDYSVKSHDSSY